PTRLRPPLHNIGLPWAEKVSGFRLKTSTAPLQALLHLTKVFLERLFLSPPSTARFPLPPLLRFICLDDRGDHRAEFALQFGTAGVILKFHALAFAADQAGFSKNLEMLRERRFRQ